MAPSIRFKTLALALIVASFVAGSCGGSGSPVPDVVGLRLDVARSDVEDAGYEVEVLGGGVFGVVVESNWVVCDQDPQGGSTDVDKVKLIVDRAGLCGGASSSAGGSTGATSASTGGTGAGATGSATAGIVVPDVVGLDLQTAQDTLQAVGFYDLGSHDVTGESSFQILDRDWVVVDQIPAAGSIVDPSTRVELGVKRR